MRLCISSRWRTEASSYTLIYPVVSFLDLQLAYYMKVRRIVVTNRSGTTEENDRDRNVSVIQLEVTPKTISIAASYEFESIVSYLSSFLLNQDVGVISVLARV